MKHSQFISCGVIAFALTLGSARADQINGAITISGGAVMDSNVLNTATRVDEWINPSIRSVSGDFDTFIDPLDAASMTAPWHFNAGLPALWSVGGFTFDLLSSAVVFQDSGFLVVQGPGVAYGNGFEPTEGIFTFTTQEPDALGVFSFSASVSNEPKGRLGDFVWHDQNADGVQDAGESGIPNVTVHLLDCEGNFIAEDITDGDGLYLFDSLAEGEYLVKVFPPAGFSISPANQTNDAEDSDADSTGLMSCTTLDSGETDLTWDAGLYVRAAIGDFVWIDSDNDGIQDLGESGVAGATVNLYDCVGALIGSMPTAADGSYLFTDLIPGSYNLEFILPDGFSFTLQDQGADDGQDSDANPVTGRTVCTTLDSGEIDRTWDAGLVRPCPPGLLLTKIAVTPEVQPGGTATYKYIVTNTGCTPLTGIQIIDDNGTPDFAGDDFEVGTVDNLAPGESAELTVTVNLPLDLCGPPAGGSTEAGLLITEALPSGDIKVTFIQSFNRNDNTYGINSVGWKANRPHRFRDLLNSDQVTFRITDSDGNEVLKFQQDYLGQSEDFASGYGSLGVNGGDGQMIAGSAANLYGFSSSLAENLNKEPFLSNLSEYTVNSPVFPTAGWEYRMIYQFIVKAEAFGASSFGGVSVIDQHNSPPKSGDDSFEPTPCTDCIVNTATATATAGQVVLSSTAQAEVCISNPPPPPGEPPTGLGTGTPGYWMNHSKAWPSGEIEIGGTTYSRKQAIKLMKSSVAGDKTLNMFAQLVAAKLNVAIGNEDSCIADTISAADSWMSLHPAGSSVDASSSAWEEGSPLHSKLDQYNNGQLCAPSRD